MAEGDDRLGETLQGESSPQGQTFSKSEFFGRPLPAETIAALVENLTEGRISGQSRELDFTPWGGAYNRVSADATAFVHRDERFLLKHAVVIDPDASKGERKTARRWLARSWASVRPWGSGRVYPNFPDPDLEDWAQAYYGTNYDRLLRVKAQYDPGNIFCFQQSL
jgi:FAD/FMN-containing dehydrogenase